MSTYTDYDKECDDIIRRLKLPSTSLNELIDKIWPLGNWWDILETVKISGWEINQLNEEMRYRHSLLTPKQLSTIKYNTVYNCGIPGFTLWKIK